MQEQHDLMEVFSPPRVVPTACGMSLTASVSIDIITGYDLATWRGRHETIGLIGKYRPRVLVLSPPCTMFSRLMHRPQCFVYVCFDCGCFDCGCFLCQATTPGPALSPHPPGSLLLLHEVENKVDVQQAEDEPDHI